MDDNKCDDGFYINIEKDTRTNKNYRKVLYTTKEIQLVEMSLSSGEEIGAEVHPGTTQFIRIESGNGTAYVEDHKISLSDGVAIVVPAGKKHNVINSGKKDMKLYTIYSPPEHEPGLIQKQKS